MSMVRSTSSTQEIGNTRMAPKAAPAPAPKAAPAPAPKAAPAPAPKAAPAPAPVAKKKGK